MREETIGAILISVTLNAVVGAVIMCSVAEYMLSTSYKVYAVGVVFGSIAYQAILAILIGMTIAWAVRDRNSRIKSS